MGKEGTRAIANDPSGRIITDNGAQAENQKTCVDVSEEAAFAVAPTGTVFAGRERGLGIAKSRRPERNGSRVEDPHEEDSRAKLEGCHTG